ncbi:MAG: helix-turn-helix transcriptional regulator [Candidatus Binatus sp.]|uniref:helix-turn-helix domain-containing protein n=1 Tax=Candidatus Binatus sp. TaxID=2811406 RepID=UPI00272695F5|nr:helix-turn-helix transcriptional regulator [Candidatus Binatus sp.]MDO8432165.1 helix-turn-helix transcriptional regulator [Candidatus Binatus sp.]
MINKFKKLWAMLRDEDARNAFVSSTIAARLAVRIYNLRKQAGWTQPELAERAHMKQARISVLEQGDYENFTFSTLKKIAAAFNVAIVIDFVSFPEFLRWSESLTAESAGPDSFDESSRKGIDAFLPEELRDLLSAKVQGVIEDTFAQARQGALQEQTKGQPLSSVPISGKNGTRQYAVPYVGQ